MGRIEQKIGIEIVVMTARYSLLQAATGTAHTVGRVAVRCAAGQAARTLKYDGAKIQVVAI